MTGPRLVTPGASFKDSYVEALREGLYHDEEDQDDIRRIDTDFEGWMRDIHDLSIPVALPGGGTTPRVPHSDYWLVLGDRFLGALSLRHNIDTEHLRAYAGHIGYSVRKSERRKGYATLMLKLALPHARALGLEKVLITCADDNIGSARVIEKAGGVFESRVLQPGTTVPKRRYWITL